MQISLSFHLSLLIWLETAWASHRPKCLAAALKIAMKHLLPLHTPRPHGARAGWLPHPEEAAYWEWSLDSTAVFWALRCFPLLSPLLGTYELTLKEPKGLVARAPGWPHSGLRFSEQRALSSLDESGCGAKGCESATERPSLNYTCITLNIGLCLSCHSSGPEKNQSLLPEGLVCREKSSKRGCYTPELQYSVR